MADGFEVALHPRPGLPDGANRRGVLGAFDTQLARSRRIHEHPSPVIDPNALRRVVRLGDGAEDGARPRHAARRELLPLPDTWIGNKPGFMNGGGFPMRFADLDGSLIDVYQANTNMTDESGQAYPATVNALLDNALGPLGYYGVFGANIHTDINAPRARRGDRRVRPGTRRPVISAKQLLDWVTGERLDVRGFSWNAGTSPSSRPSELARTASRRCCRRRAHRHAERADTATARRDLHGADDQGRSSTRCSTRSPATCQATYS